MLHFPDSWLLGGSPRIHSTIAWRAKFPAGREKCREFSPIQPIFAKIVSKTSANPAICETIPYAATQGIKLPVQGIHPVFSIGAGNLAPNRFLRPKYPIEANIIAATDDKIIKPVKLPIALAASTCFACVTEVRVGGRPSHHQVPTPRDTSGELFEAAGIAIPSALPPAPTRAAAKKKTLVTSKKKITSIYYWMTALTANHLVALPDSIGRVIP